MKWYRLYFVGEDDKILRADNVEARDDEAIRAYAVGLKYASDIEIWDLARKVGMVHAASSPAAPLPSDE